MLKFILSNLFLFMFMSVKPHFPTSCTTPCCVLTKIVFPDQLMNVVRVAYLEFVVFLLRVTFCSAGQLYMGKSGYRIPSHSKIFVIHG